MSSSSVAGSSGRQPRRSSPMAARGSRSSSERGSPRAPRAPIRASSSIRSIPILASLYRETVELYRDLSDARSRLPVGRRAGRPALHVDGRDGGPRRGSGTGRGVSRAAARRGRRRRPPAARTGARAGSVGLPGRDRLPGPAGSLDVCLRDARRTARGDDPAGPRREARRPRRHGRRGHRRRPAGRGRRGPGRGRAMVARPHRSDRRVAADPRALGRRRRDSSCPAGPSHVLEEAEIGAAIGTQAYEADPDLADFSLVPLAGVASVGSTFLAQEPDPAGWVEPILRRAAHVRPGCRRRSDPRDPRVRPTAERGRATAHRPGRGPARTGRVCRPRVVGDLHRTRLGAAWPST